MLPTKEQQEHFDEKGYIVLKDVLSDELVSSLSKLFKSSEELQLDKHFNKSQQLSRNEERLINKYNTALGIANDHDINLVPIEEWRHTTIYWQEGFQNHPEGLNYIKMLDDTIGLNELLATLIHSKYLQLFNVMLWKKIAQSCDPTEVHRDYTAFNMKGLKCAVAWISPATVRKEHGAFQVSPGSHKGVDHTTKHFMDKDYNARDKYNLVTLEIEPKDVIILDLRLVHAATPNVSDLDRYAMTLRYLGDDMRYYNRLEAYRLSLAGKPLPNNSKYPTFIDPVAGIKDDDLFPSELYPMLWQKN